MTLKRQNQSQESPQTQQSHLKALKSGDELPIVCKHCGASDYRKNGSNKGTGTQIYWCKQCSKNFTVEPERPEIIVNPQAEYEKDIWDCRRLGLSDDVGKCSYKLDFTTVEQPWMRHSLKLYLKMCLARLTFGSTQEKLYALKHLSKYLAKHYEIDPV